MGAGISVEAVFFCAHFGSPGGGVRLHQITESQFYDFCTFVLVSQTWGTLFGSVYLFDILTYIKINVRWTDIGKLTTLSKSNSLMTS